jgi:hypothetical protein
MVRSEMRWEMGFSASEITSTAFSNPKILPPAINNQPTNLATEDESCVLINLGNQIC